MRSCLFEMQCTKLTRVGEQDGGPARFGRHDEKLSGGWECRKYRWSMDRRREQYEQFKWYKGGFAEARVCDIYRGFTGPHECGVHGGRCLTACLKARDGLAAPP